MLNARKLSELLTKNVHKDLYPRFLVMSANGTLLAYSTPADIQKLRDEATLISMAWKENLSKGEIGDPNRHLIGDGKVATGALETLMVQLEDRNVLARAVQPRMILVMFGGYPPGKKQEFKMTPEYKGDERYPPAEPEDRPDGWTRLTQVQKDAKLGVLHTQRKKLDLLAEFIREELDESGFVMPEDGQFK